jgi:uncharacterized tellurite resistance protein B-like protein
MVWLLVFSAVAIALIVWINRQLPRASRNQSDDGGKATAESDPSAQKALPAASLRAAPASPMATGTETPRQPEPVARIVPLIDQPVAKPERPVPSFRAPTGVRWVPFGEDVQLRNTTIRGGGFYFGQTSELALPVAGCVDPTLAIDISAPDWSAKDTHYYPTYATIGPRERGAFVAWLHSKRDYAQLGIGLVFLYFMGLERRLLVDARSDTAAQAEIRAICAEVQRLLTVYGQNASFRSYANELLSLASALYHAGDVAIDETTESWTTALRIQVGRRMQNREPIAAAEAFAIARAVTPESQRSKWDIVLPELRTLFERRFARTFPNGLKLPTAKARVTIDYRWASPEGHSPRFLVDVPDPSTLTAPYRPLSALLDAALLDIEPLRKVRRSKNRTPSAELAATPAELLRTNVPAEFARLRADLEAALGDQHNVPMDLAALTGPLKLTAEALTKRSATQLVQTLESLGFGIEPDPRFHGQLPSAGGVVQIFRVKDDYPRMPTPAYSTAQLLAQAAIAIAESGNGIQPSEVDALIAGVERQFALTPAEHARLQAHVQMLHRTPPQISRIESKARLLAENDRASFGQVLIDIAAADGHISPTETKLLERLYKALGIDIGKVHADLHHATVKINRGDRSSGHALSADVIAQRLAETQRVQAVLTAIFVDDSPTVAAPAMPAEAVPAVVGEPPVGMASLPRHGLDAAHGNVLHAVLSHGADTVSRATLESWCDTDGLLTEGAIETLNSAAFNVAGEALLEGEDPLEINAYAAEQLRSTL